MTSLVDTSVKFLHSGMVGAPVLSGQVGSLLAVLDACLLNGWGVKTVTSLVVLTNVATLNTSAGFSAEVGSVIIVYGSTPAALNGEQKVTAVGTGTVSFVTSGITDQTATGSITFKQAPLGWVSDFSGTNLKTYRSNETTATKSHLRVDDTDTTRAKICGYVTMSSVSVGTDQFPKDKDVPDSAGGYWWKSSVTDSSARNWMIVGDGRLFYFAVAPATVANYGNNYLVSVFGDPTMLKSADPFGAILSCIRASYLPNYYLIAGYQHNMTYSSSRDIGDLYSPREHSGLGSVCDYIHAANQWGYLGNATSWPSGLTPTGSCPYPNPVDGGMLLSQVLCSSRMLGTTNWVHRCKLPGLWLVPQIVPGNYFKPRDVLTGVTDLPGKTLKCVTTQQGSDVDLCNPAFFEITGPWR